MLVIDVAFFLLELGVGLVVGSLALMADAFHMVWTQTIPDLVSADRF
jgi:Co/Zn/Cd efflux system component